MVNLKIKNSRINNLKLVIFDKDGTLIDLYHYCHAMVRLRAKLFSKILKLNKSDEYSLMFAMGVDYKRKCLRKEGPIGVKKRSDVLYAANEYLKNKGFKNSTQICREVFRNVDKFTEENIGTLIKETGGICDFINKLKKKSCKVAIATNDKTHRADLITRYLNIRDKIDLIIGSDKASKGKPDPQMVNIILRKLGVKKYNAAIVGDTYSDLEMGLNAGLTAAIGFFSGVHSKNKLLKMTPYVVDRFSQIKIMDS